MDDGALRLELDVTLSKRLKVAAREAGRSVDDYAAQLIAQGLDDRWSETQRRLEDYDRTGEYVPADEALARFRSAIAERIRKPA
ncbi:MAG TPA: hypothetical protein VHZ26_00690 [Caulobacteraceae bacterium]|jgi:hypothetical protein|nr:hypothetical protein [Caulobacteraceae bacterium]